MTQPSQSKTCRSSSLFNGASSEERDALLEEGFKKQLYDKPSSSSNETETITNDDSDENNSNDDGKSTGQRILELAVPAAGALLIDPLMNLVDTAFVGRFGNAAAATIAASSDTNNAVAATATTSFQSDPLAGMGSAAALLTFSFYLFNFLCTATTPLVARERAAGQEKKAIAVGGQALSLSLLLGVSLSVLLLTLKQPLLRVMGTGITGPVANEYALQFLSVRALAAPAVLCIEASTGVLRGYLDTKTPIVVLIGANLINLILDILLIVWLQLGPMGAAIATTTAEWISAASFLLVLAGKLPSAAGEVGSNRPNPVSILPSASIPSWKEIQPLVVASSSVFLRAVVLQASLSAAAATVARTSSSGMELDGIASAAVAAHQVGIQLWILCSFFCDSLAAASQGLIADAIGRDDPNAVRDVSMTVFAYSLGLGLFLAAILLGTGQFTTVLQDVFTQDASVQTALSEILPLIALAQPLNALVFAADGVLQGAAQFPFQAKAMALSGATAVASFVALDLWTSSGGDLDFAMLVHVWTALLVLQGMRGLTSLYKLVEKKGPINLLNR